jgi:hypothetical protein
LTAERSEPVRDAFHRVLDWLEEARLPYAVMGGLAFAVHGVARATFDVDVVVAADEERVVSFLRKASERGASVEEPFLRGWTDTLAGMRKVGLLIGTLERPVAVDLFLVTTPFQRSAFSRRRDVMLGDRRFPVIAAEDLILFKLIAARRKDDADVVDLLTFGGPLDLSYLKRWAARLRVLARLRARAREAGREDLA